MVRNASYTLKFFKLIYKNHIRMSGKIPSRNFLLAYFMYQLVFWIAILGSDWWKFPENVDRTGSQDIVEHCASISRQLRQTHFCLLYTQESCFWFAHFDYLMCWFFLPHVHEIFEKSSPEVQKTCIWIDCFALWARFSPGIYNDHTSLHFPLSRKVSSKSTNCCCRLN